MTFFRITALGLLISLGLTAQILTPIVADTRHNSVSYTGPGDIVSFSSWYGLRCYATAYSGNVAAVWDSATGTTVETLLTCSSGGTINQTINPLSTTCTVGCVVKTLYDQAGGGFDLTQSTLANMPTYTANCVGTTKPCMSFISAQLLVAGSGWAQFGSLSFSMVAERTSGFNAFTDVLGTSPNGNVQFGFYSSAATSFLFGGTVATVVTTDSAFHGMQGLINGASSKINIDGTSNTVSAGGSSVASDALCMGKCTNGGNPFNVTEAGAANGDISAFFAALNTNQHAYWGF